ncbi:general odorant-binding protein 72-like, partial [Chironomus tepperi]
EVTSMKRTLFIVTFIITVHNLNCAKITIEQMQQATEPVRMVCIQKSKVSQDALESMRAGKLGDGKELKCYISCVLEMMNMVKKGKMNVDSVIKNIDTLMPDELREDTKRAVSVCKDFGAGNKDYCDAAYTILKCFFKENPNFFFP